MYVSVKLLYRDGVLAKTQPPTVGQIYTDQIKTVPVLLLRPVGWVHNESTESEPLAVLWHPVLVGVGYDSLCFRGVEAVPRGRSRRWASQKWLCDVLDAERARNQLEAQS